MGPDPLTTDADETDLTDGPRPAYLVGVPHESRTRLLGLGAIEPVLDGADASLVVMSTRLRRADVAAELAAAASRALPVVVLAHTGGEAAAVEMMRNGGQVVLAEGNETALLPFLDGGAGDSGILETYEQRIGSAHSTTTAGERGDAATGLPGRSAFEERLEHLDQDGELPRMAFLRVLNLADAMRMSSGAVLLLRRRLALQLLALARGTNAELFSLRDDEIALVAVGLSPNRAEHLARQMTRVVESFAPSGAQPLALAVGHAGPEVASEIATLRELASRAVMVAAESGSSRIVGADSLSLGLAATTELEAALRILEVVERSDGHLPGHGARVAAMAHDIARHLGFEPDERTQVRLAGHLADVGKIGLGLDAAVANEAMTPDQRRRYEQHPQRGAQSLRASAGQLVADAIACHHECWDGSGFPDGRSGNDIPVIARIIAAADMFDGLVNAAAEERRLPLGAALQALTAQAGAALDPAIVEAAVAVVGAHHLVPSRA